MAVAYVRIKMKQIFALRLGNFITFLGYLGRLTINNVPIKFCSSIQLFRLNFFGPDIISRTIEPFVGVVCSIFCAKRTLGNCFCIK